MLQVKEFDLKTGKGLTEYEPQTQQRRPKSRGISHSYLEHWLTHHGLSGREFWMARFYPGVVIEDQQRLEQEGKVLVLAKGEQGYFTDAETARLLTQGDGARGITPLYHPGPALAHHWIAYGGLVLSEGLASTVVQSTQRPVRLLVVDESRRDGGLTKLSHPQGRPLMRERLNLLLARLGDGTMLVSESLFQGLFQESVQRPAQSLDPVLGGGVDQGRVHQFRAATPDLPGLLKGTLSCSAWTHELAVDAICSVSVFKGDDGRLSTPGLHELSQLWVNRKLMGQYRRQAVGVQLKGMIPDATAAELNPRVLAQAQEFACQAGDAQWLAEAYLKAQRLRQGESGFVPEAEAGASAQTQDEPLLLHESEDWLSQILRQDQYGVMLNGFPTVIDKLERFVRHERLDQALRGIRIPAAMAQPHGRLKPWEVCNRNLPVGALVAYYRSPVPNVSAVGVALNNPGALKRCDPEAFHRRGVAYLNPWTAREIAITDFDGDVNAYFVGYLPAQAGLPQWVRQQLAATDSLPPAQQYEAARQLLADLIQQLNQGIGPVRIAPGDYPRTVAEFIERTAPARKPPKIAKQPKLYHPWHDHETLAEATWRGWNLTAENPIGRVANAGMVLQSFASECRYARTNEAQEALLRQLSSHFYKLLRQAEQGKLEIPESDRLQANGLPGYDFKARLSNLAQAGPALEDFPDVQGRSQYLAHALQAAHDLFWEVANGPNAANLQTAVDGAKSARGIDETLHQFALALQYKPHLLRQHRQDPNVYTAGRTLPSNTDEPIGWMVEAVNECYEESALGRADNVGMRFGCLMEGIDFDGEQAAAAQHIVVSYLELMAERAQAQRQLQREGVASRQPSLTLTSSQTGRSLRVERLIDGTAGHEAEVQDLWRSQGPTDWEILVEPVRQNDSLVFAVKRSVGGQPSHLLGWVSATDVERHQLERFFQTGSPLPRRPLVLRCPEVEVHPPLLLENDGAEMLERAQDFLKAAKAAIPVDQQAAYAAAMWSLKLPTGQQPRGRSGQRLERQAKLGMGVVLQLFPEVVGERLRQLPALKLSGFRYREMTPEPGEYELVTRPYRYLDRAGFVQEVVALALVEGDPEVKPEPKHLGYLGERTLQLPLGLRLQAQIYFDFTPPVVQQGEVQHASVTVQVKALLGQELGEAAHRTGGSQLGPASSFYAPTYRELQDWWRGARVQQDVVKMAEISHLGQRLGEQYRSSLTTQLPNSPLPVPEANYRSLAVVLDVQQHQQMKADQACYEVINSVLAAPTGRCGFPGQSQREGANP